MKTMTQEQVQKEEIEKIEADLLLEVYLSLLWI